MRTLKVFYISALALAAAGTASAMEVSTQPGQLSLAVGEGAESVTELTVSGALNVVDFEFLSLSMPHLVALDLSAASVEAYSGEATYFQRTDAPANELPDGALMLPELRNLKLPAGITSIGSGAIAATSIKSIEIPASVTSIGNAAFSCSKNLESIVLPSSVTELGQGVFSGCTALKSATLSGSLNSLSAATFLGCTALKSVSLPASVATIGEQAFAGCSSLESIEVPASLTKVGTLAFYGAGLSDLDLSKSSLSEIGKWAFANQPALSSVSFPETIASMGEGAFANNTTLTLSEIPAGISAIPNYSLRGVNTPAELTIPESVSRIGNYALADWKGISTLNLPSSLESIGTRAMANWSELKTINASGLIAVPVLGAEVWKGVDQSKATLKVSADTKEAFTNAPQWNEFIIDAPTGPTYSPEIPAETAAVTALFQGMVLHIDAPTEIASVQIFDLGGRAFNIPSSRQSTHISVDTSAWDTPVMIVRVQLLSGSAATLKLSR